MLRNLFVFISALLVSVGALAQTGVDSRIGCLSNDNIDYEFGVVINGKLAKQLPHGSDTYIEGRTGQKYDLRFKNNTSRRVEIVVSVDGLGILNGEISSGSENGYVIPPNTEVTLRGWRLDDKSVAKFVFATAGKSYAVKTGHGAKNLGVIGCRVFPERSYGRIQGLGKIDTGGDLGFRGTSKSSEQKTRGIGTGFGNKVRDEIGYTHFNRASSIPAAEMILRYGDLATLRRLGVNLNPSDVVAKPENANPFPAQPGCPPPPGWTSSGK